jgi:type VI secretion system secreted protein Hcp
MRSLTAVPLGLLCCLAIITPSRALAAQDVFLAIPGLNGESADEQFRGAFEALSVTAGIASDSTAAAAGGAGAGKPTFPPVLVKLRRTTAGSAALEEAVSSGQRFPQAVVSVRRAGENPVVVLTHTLTNVGVTSFQRDANAADDTPSESVSLTYAQIRTEHRTLNADGSAGPTVVVCWDVTAVMKCQ